MLALAVFTGAWLIAQATPLPGWDDLLKQFVSQAFPVLLGLLVHWLGAKFGARTASGNAPPSADSTP